MVDKENRFIEGLKLTILEISLPTDPWTEKLHQEDGMVSIVRP